MFKFLADEKEYINPPYIDQIEQLEFVQIIRLQGDMDQTIIPMVEERVQENRRRGGKIDQNVILDFAKVEKIDTAVLAYHLLKLEEFREAQHRFGFINFQPSHEALLSIFNLENRFFVYSSEAEAIKDLNKVV